MKNLDFSEDFQNRLESQIEQALKQGAEPVAAFDADGTLWDTDIGENFFQYQITHKHFENYESAWQTYKEKKSAHPPDAYIYLAQLNAGRPITEVRAFSKACVDSQQPVPIITASRNLIQFLKSRDVEVFVVTASIKWAVEPAAALLGIDQDHVLGVKTAIDQEGLVTTQQDGPITWKEGKATALLEKTNGRSPFLAAGNTLGDIGLLKAATHIPLALSAASLDDDVYESEVELQQLAKPNNWASYRFS